MACAHYPNLVFLALLAFLVTRAIYLGKGQAVVKLRLCCDLGQILNRRNGQADLIEYFQPMGGSLPRNNRVQ